MVGSLLAQNGLQDLPIYRMIRNEQEQYCTPREFDTTACIVNPSKEEHRTLCLAIKDLRLADANYLHFWLRTEEWPKHFNRLIRAFEVIETPTAAPKQEQEIKTHLLIIKIVVCS